MKTMEEIYREMVEIFAQRTGLDVGADGDLAVRFYAVAAQIHGLYMQAAWTEKQCFPQTAGGEYLDHHAALRGLERKKAARAEGSLRFSVKEAAQDAITIPAGTVCMTAGLVRFETLEEGRLEAGALAVEVPAAAVETGSAGNAAAGTVVQMAVAPVGIAACTNPEAFAGGSDDESDEELRTRVMETYRRLSNGANAAFYKKKAMSFDEVVSAVVLPRARGVGTVDVVITSREGVPDEELLEQVRSCFDEVREIAVDVTVLKPETQTVDVSVSVKAAENYDSQTVLEQAAQALSGYFDGTRLGKDVLRAELGAAVYAVEGVENYVLSAPAADTAIGETVLPVLGTLSVEAMD